MLFFKKKPKEEVKPVNEDSEFKEDIAALLARDDITCRPEICEAEFAKGQGLAESGDSDKVMRAYHIMGHLASEFEYIPAIMWMGDFAENVKKNLEEAVEWYKTAADMGDGNGARCYADMLMTGNGVRMDFNKAMEYYQLAAERGIPEAMFVVGEHLRNKGQREAALDAYKKSYEAGYSVAKVRIDQMMNGSR